MSQDKKIQAIREINQLLTQAVALIELDNVCDPITPEGRILTDVFESIEPANKRVGVALELAESHR